MSFLKNLALVTAVVLGSLVVTQAASAQSTIETRIVGGTESDPGEWSWMVALSFEPNPTALDAACGGTLIDQSWVLTAAHCVHDGFNNVIEPSVVVSYVGAYDLSNSLGTGIGITRAISKIIVHPEYNPDTTDNDIALLKLSTPVDTVTPINIINSSVAATLENAVDDGLNDFSAIGWGNVDPANPSYPVILRDVALPYVSNNVCNTSLLGGQVTENMLCAGVPVGGVDSCQGDSGGPLVFSSGGQWYQAGLVSWGIGCAQANSYGVYTRVNNYTQWIELILNGYLVTPDVQFGTWLPGLTTTAIVSIENFGGSAPLNVSVSANTSNTAYTVVNDSCSSSSVNFGASCDVTIKFVAGSTVGDVAGALVINTDNTFTPVLSIPLKSTVVAETTFSYVSASNSIKWALGGDTGWLEVQGTGAYSLQSGEVANTQNSSLFAYVTVGASGTRDVYFDWKVCSEYDWDFLELWVDNVKTNQGISGNVDWVNHSITLTGEGDHVIEWRYNKDSSATFGTDVGWLGNIGLDSVLSAPLPVYSCNLIRQTEEPAPSIVTVTQSSGGGAMSGWFYLVFGLPLMMRRRFRKH